MSEPNPFSEEAEEAEDSQVINLKPRQGSFMFRRLMIGLVLSLALGIVAALVLGFAGLHPALALGVVVLAFAFNAYAALVAFRKERYEIHGDRVLCHRGGIFGDETTELELRNVTHLKIMLPWLRHKILGIGHVVVESAGSSQPIVMLALPDPKGAYELLTSRLKNNGFDLTQEQLLHEEQPAMEGVVIDVLGGLFGMAFLLLFGSAGLVGLIQEVDSKFWSMVIGLFGLLALASLFFFVIVHAIDLRRRTYRVFNDVVVYEEGFLTRNNALIPYENIADASTKRTFVDRIVGMYDVQISCQGGGSEIKFRHLKRGDELSNTIDALVSAASSKPKWKPEGSPTAAQRPSREKPEFRHEGPMVIGSYQMNAARVFLPTLVLLPLFPLFVVAIIGQAIRRSCTKYSLKGDSLKFEFSFLNSNSREFAYDKVTGVVVKRNLLDRMMGTMTLKFWSIGSSQAIEFQYLKQEDIDLPSLLAQLGVPPANSEPCNIPIDFNPGAWSQARFNMLPGIVLLIVAMLVLGAALNSYVMVVTFFVVGAIAIAVINLVYGYMYYPRQRLLFYPHHVEAIQGILSISHYHACYHHIKRRKVIRYPGIKAGSLEIFVAGEQQMGKGAQESDKKTGVVRQCSFTTGFLADASEAGQLLDDILCGRVDPAPGAVSAEPMEELMEAPRAVKNSVIGTVLVCVILFPLLVALPFLLIWVCVSIPKWRYRMDAVRMIIDRGIFYKTRETILLDRVDSLQQNQGPLHKICSNGNVSIMTAGSSKPDMRIVNCPDYRQVYDMVRDQTQ